MKTKKIKATAACIALCMVGAFVSAGCPSATEIAGWVDKGLNIIAVVGPTINPLIGAIAALAGKTIDAKIVADINKGLTIVQTNVPLVNNAIQSYKNSPDPTTLGRINSLLTEIGANLNSATLAANSVTDPTSQQNVLDAIALLQQTFKNLQAAVPPTNPVTAKFSKKDQARISAALDPAAFKAKMHAIASRQTGNVAVDKAFAELAEKSK